MFNSFVQMKVYRFLVGTILIILHHDLSYSKTLASAVDTPSVPPSQHRETPHDNSTADQSGQTISSDFNIFEIISTSDAFIDKTKILKTFIEAPQDQRYVLLTAPTKFGKSAIVSMLLNFLEVPLNDKGEFLDKTTTSAHKLFYESDDKFFISSDRDFKERHFAQYPVIYLSFGGFFPHLANADSSEQQQLLHNYVARVIEKSILRYKHFITNSNLQEGKELLKILNTTINFDFQTLGSLLHRFNALLQTSIKRSTILLVDKYDILLQLYLAKNGDAVYAAHLMDTLFSSLLRNSTVEYAFIAGTSNLIRAERSSSSANTLKSYPFLKDHQYTEYVGMTENELQATFAKFNANAGQQDEIKKYYNPYFTEQQKRKIYSIYSISRYFENLKYNLTSLRPIWGTSGVNGGVFLLTGLYICQKDDQVRQRIKDSYTSMGEIIEANIDHKIDVEQLQVLEEMFEFTDSVPPQYNLFYTLALELGLLSYGQNAGKLKIPNEDVRYAFNENLILPFTMANFTTIKAN